MPQHATPLEPQQERSRRTLARLLSVAIRTLHEGGLERATIPRIAHAAGVSPATVYRRFKDKQDLLRAAFLHMLEKSASENQERLPEELNRPTLEQAARRFIELSFAQYREHGRLLGALQQFISADPGSEFAQAARRIIEHNLDVAVQALLAYRKEIAHPDPERAVRIAILTASTVIEAMFFAPSSPWATLQPISHELLVEELARGYVAYLTYR
jgi:AcrR family transcriptional regulator